MSDIGVLNGPATAPKVLTVTGDQEVKEGASASEDRRVVVIYPVNGDILWAYGTTAVNGFLWKKDNILVLEASSLIPITVRAVDGVTSTEVRIQEVG
jgi:hypothetical protein